LIGRSAPVAGVRWRFATEKQAFSSAQIRCLKSGFARIARKLLLSASEIRGKLGKGLGHSHSLVAGGSPLMSYTMRETPLDSLTMRR